MRTVLNSYSKKIVSLLFAGVRGPQELSDFWLALPQAEISHAGKVLSLVDGMSFLGDRCLGKKLYIRECYEGLERELKELFARKDDSGRKEINAVAIIGDPGGQAQPFLLSPQ